jgi:hypothetical protein
MIKKYLVIEIHKIKLTIIIFCRKNYNFSKANFIKVYLLHKKITN